MWNWLPAVLNFATGALSTGGQVEANRANARMAREQMDFQERMSNTSAQRAVEDYRKAGLNPALAYDRGASSPGGASATMGDVISPGVNSAQQAQRLRQELKQSREQHLENLRLTRSQTMANEQAYTRSIAETRNIAAEEKLRDQQFRFNDAIQPYQSQLARANALLTEYQLPGAKNTAQFEQMIGTLGKTWGTGITGGLSWARTAAEIAKMLRGGKN